MDEKTNYLKEVTDKTALNVKPFCSSIEYTLVDEALMAFESENYIVLFGDVLTLSYVFAVNSGVIIKRLESLRCGVEIEDVYGNVIKIPAYSLMRVVCSDINIGDRYLKSFRDVDGNLVHVYVSKLMETYYYIGRVLHISLFEMLKDNYIKLPVELYSTRNIKND
jgi:hypothetical protein